MLNNGDMSFEDFDDYSSEPDFAAEAQRASEEGARQEIERQKELLLKDYIWEKFQLEKGVIFGEDQERIFIRDFCLRDDLIGSEDFGVMYQELDKKLADIENYFEKQRKKRL